MYALINVKYYDFHRYEEDVYVLFDEKILDIQKMSHFEDKGYEIIDGYNHLVMPSLVVGHTHIYSTFARGMSVEYNPSNFQEILNQLWWKLDRKLGKEEIYYSGIVSGVDYVKNGVTTVIDHHASGLAIDGSLNILKKAICDDVGIRGIFCFETSDRFNIDKCIKENLGFIKEHHEKNCIGLFGLHASMSLSENTLEKVSQVLKTSPIHIHIAESEMDQNNCLDNYGERVVERLNRHKLLNKNSILSHCIHINGKERNLIKENECYVALNVTSNMNNAVGLPDYKLLEKEGIKCLIGNDGISSSISTEWQNLYFTMHHKTKSSIDFGFDQLKDIIKNNYDYVNQVMDLKIGKIEKGYDADLLMIPYIPPTPINQDNAFGHVFFGLANSFKPSHVWCMGKHIVNNYVISNALTDKYRKSSQIAKKLWQEINKEEVD